MSRIPLTKEGEASIKEKLYNLKFVERPQISEAIAEARAHGDLKECRVSCSKRASRARRSKNY